MVDYKNADFLVGKKMNVRETPLQSDGTLLHCHPHQQISICTKGTGIYTVGKNEYFISKGDIILIYSLEQHKCLTADHNGSSFIMIELSEDFVAPKGSGAYQYQYLQPFRYDQNKVDKVINHTIPVAAEVGELAEKLKVIYDEQKLGYELEIDASIKLIVSKLRSYFLQTYPVELLSKHSNSVLINEAITYINNHFLDSIKTEDVAANAHLSVSRFRHVFKETMHISVKSYILRLKISEVQRLLITTELSVESIAAYCDFCNMSYFYRLFEQFVHMTPSEYRNASIFDACI